MRFSAPVDVIVYATPTCPDCHAVRQWLTARDIAFVERDLTLATVADEARSCYGVRVAPIVVVSGETLYGTFSSLRPRLSALLEGVPVA